MNRKQFLFSLLGLGAVAAIVPKLKAEPPVDGKELGKSKPAEITLTGKEVRLYYKQLYRTCKSVGVPT